MSSQQSVRDEQKTIMSYLSSVLACLFLLVSICQANTDGLRASSSTQGKPTLSRFVVGLAAVTGFLFIIFIILIVKRVFFTNYKDKEKPDPEAYAVYENDAFKMETADGTKVSSL